MLATGAGVQAVADAVDVHRSTLWKWRQSPAFKAYYNRLLSDIRENVKYGLIGLYEKAIDTVRDSLDSEDEELALKTAWQIIKRAENLSSGETDPDAIRRLDALQAFP